jgi:hypothetical protein
MAAEAGAPYPPSSGDDQPSEHLLHLLWQRQDLLPQLLTTVEQQSIMVYRTGRWSRSQGPDFVDVKLRCGDGPIQVGAVEVHVLASDWFHHRHHLDAAYTKVLLHVVWQNDLATPTVVDADGRDIPQLVLSTLPIMPLAELHCLLGDDSSAPTRAAGLTPCQRSLMEMTPERVGQLLDMAGEERWRQKANRFALRVERRGVEQALYETLMEALGFQGNRMPFWQLARLAPVARIREVLATVQATPLRVQAILYGVSGFLRRWQRESRRHQPARDQYVATLADHWEPMATLFPESVDQRLWRTAGIRPANSPQRRMAAVGYLLTGLTQYSLMDYCFAPIRALALDVSRSDLRHCMTELARRLRVPGTEDFWSRRYAIDRPEQSHPIDLLGPGRASTMVVDVLLPAAAALAQLSYEPIRLDVARALYGCHPCLPTNELLRAMLRQFFGADRARAAIVRSACRQQGLLQLYKDFCLNELETCQECAFPRLLARLEWRRTETPPTGS